MTDTIELPTIEECHAFMDAINRGRTAVGLEPIEKLEYDKYKPGRPDCCLSAYHLFATEPVGGEVFAKRMAVDGSGDPVVVGQLAAALGTRTVRGGYELVLPEEILAVTNVFDEGYTVPFIASALRERLQEAGLVD